MKRNLLFAGAIVGVVGASLMTFSYAILFLAIIFNFSVILNSLNADIPQDAYQVTSGVLIFLAVILFIMIIIGVFAIIFNAKSIGISKLSHDQFIGKKNNVIAAITFNFITLTIILIVAAILMIVDLSREKERITENATENVVANVDAPKTEQKQEEPLNVEKNTIVVDKLSALEKDLNTIKNLRDKELITDEEYEKLRAERINQHINNI